MVSLANVTLLFLPAVVHADSVIRVAGCGRVRLQADLLNLTNRLNVIDFAGLFSGTALAPPRSVAVRLQAEF